MTEAIGEPKVLREMLKRLAAKEWTGKAVKMRARGRDGQAVVTVLRALDWSLGSKDAPSDGAQRAACER